MITVTRVDSRCDVFYILIGNRLSRTRTVATFDRRLLVEAGSIEDVVKRRLAETIWLSMPVHDH